MNPVLRQEEDIFDTARQIPDAAGRAAYLDRVCNGDTRLRSRVDELLGSLDAAEDFFMDGSSAVQSLGGELQALTKAGTTMPGDEQIGTRIGNYKLLERIGEGGCGVVYMAEQERPVRRRVALKIIKLGMDTKSVIARFEAERQALAMMDHPNIARVLDAGATETGRPYFVMELVRGFKITEYCDANHLDTLQRLNLFIEVCHAIQHAHQKGIIHRDIKPSNILVTMHDGVPVPKVIDFGIAKATEARLTDKTLFTAYAQLIGTPAYMSPEQAEMSGLDVDTRSDIYSLGVLLYELLTGKTPFDARQLLEAGFDEMRRTLREREPQKPSTILTTLQNEELTITARHRHAEPPKLISQLLGDLDWIVMKALDKDRKRRYETANGMAMDIRRYLDNEPVLARPPSRYYRLQKLVRRNRPTFVAAGVVALVLVLGFAVSTWLFLKERQARQRASDAEQQQVRLRLDAEISRANEAQLRQQAELREKIAQAAVLLGQERFDEADELGAVLSPVESSIETASVFRSLGEWHALRHEWKQAAERFVVMLKVNQSEGPDVRSLDLLEQGVCLVEGGDTAGYEHFRHAVIRQFADTTYPVAAERVVKISLLVSAGDGVMRSLAPLAKFASESFLDRAGHPAVTDFQSAWGSISVGLIEYRRGHYEKAAEWARRCLAFQEFNAPRSAAAHVVLGMALYRLDQPGAASSEIAQARESIEARLQGSLDRGTASEGFWFDWHIARILLREASSQTAEK